MTIQKLMELKHSNAAPFNHDAYTVWLHNQIIDDIRYSLWKKREFEFKDNPEKYTLITSILGMDLLKTI